MNKSNLKLICCLMACLISLLSCKKEPSQAAEQQALEQMFTELKTLAAGSDCSGALKYIAVGTKACGGPTTYLAYSTSIDVATFEQMVANYNQRQLNYNKKWNIVSDCAFLMPPKAVTCENGKPTLVNVN